jgi:hypothetical protein
MAYEQTPQGKDPMLWDLAKRRASFRSHLITYVVINAFLWALWFITGGRESRNGLPWPVWPALGWGIGLAFHYFGAYGTDGQNAVEKEYEKLQNKKNQTI